MRVYCTLTFHINLEYTHHLETQCASSTITATILSTNLVVQTQLATYLERKVFQVHRITKYQNPGFFFVAINSLGTDADEVITEALP